MWQRDIECKRIASDISDDGRIQGETVVSHEIRFRGKQREKRIINDIRNHLVSYFLSSSFRLQQLSLAA